MTIRTLENKSDHDKMVVAMARKFEAEGMFVKADHIGHRNGQPNMVYGHIPDVEAVLNNKKILAEAETQDTFDNPETKNQFVAFSRADAEFHVIVPKECLDEIKRKAAGWGVTVNQYWTMEV